LQWLVGSDARLLAGNVQVAEERIRPDDRSFISTRIFLSGVQMPSRWRRRRWIPLCNDTAEISLLLATAATVSSRLIARHAVQAGRRATSPRRISILPHEHIVAGHDEAVDLVEADRVSGEIPGLRRVQ
jgi:hypothetical protein